MTTPIEQAFTDALTPKSLDDIIGQPRAMNLLKSIEQTTLKQDVPCSLIFHGPPGMGKTASANLLAQTSNRPWVALNATNASTKDIHALAERDDHPIVYLDEIQAFNKKQQQVLLPYIEQDVFTLIAATAENPKAYVYDALYSRSTPVRFERINPEILATYIKNAAHQSGADAYLSDELIDTVAHQCAGDVRHAKLLCLEYLRIGEHQGLQITPENAVDTGLAECASQPFDLTSATHYQLVSALQKSIRGSDVDAAIFYATRLTEGGDLESPIRRMLVMASEDIGLADPQAIQHTIACAQAAKELGLPEAGRMIAQMAAYLALAPKSDSVTQAWSQAKTDIAEGRGAIVPGHISVECPKNYLYPHSYPNHWVPQQYLPDDLLGTKYYQPQPNAFENAYETYWKSVRGEM